MFTIWVKWENAPIIKIEVDDIVTAQCIWEDLKARGYHMMSARP